MMDEWSATDGVPRVDSCRSGIVPAGAKLSMDQYGKMNTSF